MCFRLRAALYVRSLPYDCVALLAPVSRNSQEVQWSYIAFHSPILIHLNSRQSACHCLVIVIILPSHLVFHTDQGSTHESNNLTASPGCSRIVRVLECRVAQKSSCTSTMGHSSHRISIFCSRPIRRYLSLSFEIDFSGMDTCTSKAFFPGAMCSKLERSTSSSSLLAACSNTVQNQ